MAITLLSRKEHAQVLSLLQSVMKGVGKKHLLQQVEHELGQRGVVLAAKDKGKVRACVFVHTGKGQARLSHLIVEEGGEELVEQALLYCLRKGVKTISAVVDEHHRSLLEGRGFVMEKKVAMRWEQRDELQSSLKEKLDRLSAVQDIAETTAQRLRTLKVK